MSDVLGTVRARLVAHFGGAEPVAASVTFLGVEPIDVLRFGPDGDVYHHVSLGCSRHPMVDAAEFAPDPHAGPRAELVVSLRGPTPIGLAQSIAIVAASPAVEGLVLVPDALIDLETPLWSGASFTAMLLGPSDVPEIVLPPPAEPVAVLTATPITPTEAAWVRLKGADAMREAWRTDGVDVLDPRRRAANPA